MKLASERGRINSSEFVTMFQEMATRPEIYFLLIRFANRDYFTAEDFRHFLECEQGVSPLIYTPSGILYRKRASTSYIHQKVILGCGSIL